LPISNAKKGRLNGRPFFTSILTRGREARRSRVSLPGALLLVLADLVAYHAADRRTADRPEGTAIRNDVSHASTDSSANRGALVTLRHPAATAQAEQHCRGDHTDCESMHCFHWNASLSKIQL
jgi:hypothetical protein